MVSISKLRTKEGDSKKAKMNTHDESAVNNRGQYKQSYAKINMLCRWKTNLERVVQKHHNFEANCIQISDEVFFLYYSLYMKEL